MKIFWLIVILIALFGELVCYAALTVASRADEWEREYWERREDEQIHRRRICQSGDDK